jgi:hypothetical protein
MQLNATGIPAAAKPVSSDELEAGLNSAAVVMAGSFFDLFEAGPDGELQTREAGDTHVRIMGEVFGAFVDAIYGPSPKPLSFVTTMLVTVGALRLTTPPMSLNQAQVEIAHRAVQHLGLAFSLPSGNA